MEYRCLERQIYTVAGFSLLPLREEDKYLVMKWRNEQIYHLRQQRPLSKQDQDQYFDTVVQKLFVQEKPMQVLFSFLQDNVCIGYGGLVHINWQDRNAEISFIMNTELEEQYFEQHWATYLSLIEDVAFKGLGLHKIYTYAFDLRPRLYTALENSGFTQETRMKEHCFFDGKFIDVVIHSKISGNVDF